MQAANITGNFTNHSLRSSATTRLFSAHVDEQLIVSRNGHTSTKWVRSYKRMSDQLLQETSTVLNSKKMKMSTIDLEEKEKSLNSKIEIPFEKRTSHLMLAWKFLM